MPATTADLLTDTENGGPPIPTTVSATRTSGSTTLACNALVDWPTNTAVHFVTGTPETDAEGNPIINPATLCLWKGVVSGTTIVNLVLRGAPSFPTDPGNNINDIVQMAPTSSWAHDMFVAATKDHNTLGNHQTLHDINANTWLGQTATASAVNYVNVANSATGNSPTISAQGADANIDLLLRGKGTGVVDLGIPYKFSVILSTNQTVSANTWSKVNLNSKTYDTSSNFDAVTNFQFTAPVNGFYSFNATIVAPNISDTGLVSLGLNVGSFSSAPTYILDNIYAGANSVTMIVSASKDIQLTAGQTVQLYGQTGSITFQGSANGAFCIFEGKIFTKT